MTFTVRLEDRDVRFAVDDGETILSAGLRQGLALPFGCQSGGCGSCRVRCVAGRVSYGVPPIALSPAALDELRPRKLPARVLERTMLAHDVIGLNLKLPRNGKPFRWLAGQYIDFLLADGRRRSFSIANAWAADAPLELHLRVTPGGR